MTMGFLYVSVLPVVVYLFLIYLSDYINLSYIAANYGMVVAELILKDPVVGDQNLWGILCLSLQG
jgi:hypothetical protein